MKKWATLLVMALLLSMLPLVEGGEKKAYVAEVEGMIAQGTVNQFEKAIDLARDGELLIIMLNTNGGLSGAMEEIIKMVENAPIPVVIYVAPPGAKAFSAGTFILMASHVAAMGKATTIGACHPRIINPATGMAEDAGEKETNAYSAMMKSLAMAHGRNASMAEDFVKNNTALNEQEAMEADVIEIVANDIEDLMEKLNGMVVKVRGENYTINTSGLEVVKIKWGLREKFINYLSDPQIASLLLTIGIFGLIFGFLTPGFHFPETLGAILIILSLYGLSFIGVGAAGVLLIFLAFLFFIIEVHTPTFGFWTAAAIITFIFGIMLLPAGKALHEMPQEWYTSFRIASIMVAVFVTAFFSYAVAMAMKTRRKKPRIGGEEMVGKDGIALTDISPEGQIKVEGEIWKAISDEEIKEGEKVIIIEQQRLTLKVKKK